MQSSDLEVKNLWYIEINFNVFMYIHVYIMQASTLNLYIYKHLFVYPYMHKLISGYLKLKFKADITCRIGEFGLIS